MDTLEEQHVDATRGFLQRTSVPIIARESGTSSNWYFHGTAAWFRVPQVGGATRLFLLTAAHVLFQDPAEFHPELYVPTTRPRGFTSSDTVRLSDIGLATYATADARRADTDRMDSAVLEIRDRSVAERILGGEWEMLDTSNIGPHAASAGVDGVGYMISGYPSSMTESGPDHIAGMPIVLLVDRYDGDVSSMHGFDPRIDLMLKRPDRELASGEPIPPFSLHGVSGALVWALRGLNVPGVWHPRRGLVIAGHQISATPSGYIRVRRAVALARLLQKVAPEIATDIEVRLAGRAIA